MIGKIIGEKSKEKKFPCLMISKNENLVVLFFRSGGGVVVYKDVSNINYSIGEMSTNWCMDEFEVYDRKILLSN